MENLESVFMNSTTEEDIKKITTEIAKYDVDDFISRVAGLNLVVENQNKSVILDTVIQHLISNPRESYCSKEKMSATGFRRIIEQLNRTSLSSAIDPCENVFFQNVMFNGKNYLVFNGIDITPTYNLQTLIKTIFGYDNGFCPEYLKKVGILFALLLELSDKIASATKITLSSAKYNEDKKVILPSHETIEKNAGLIRVRAEYIERFIKDVFSIDELLIEFNCRNVGNINNRPFYTAPFLKSGDNYIILNISLLANFAIFKAIEWAEEYGIKQKVINSYNDFGWTESLRSLDKLGHKRIDEKKYGLECIHNSNYIEAILTSYTDQLLFVFYFCDDCLQYSQSSFNDAYPDDRHSAVFKQRLEYYSQNLHKLDISQDNTYCLIVISSIGRSIKIGLKGNPFGYKHIWLNPFELHCIEINERKKSNFLPRYIRAISQIKTMDLAMFSELNAISLYTDNNYTFYMSDDFDPEETICFFSPGDSVHYITKALLNENRLLINSYYDKQFTEVILHDSKRSIYVESSLFPKRNLALCIIYSNINLWLVTDELSSKEQIDIAYSLLDSLSYWLSECREIIELHDYQYETYSIHISLSGDIEAYYYARNTTTPFEKCIDQSIDKNHIYLAFEPEAFGNLNQADNNQEKSICDYILCILDGISYVTMDYSSLLGKVFENQLKKKIYSFEYITTPYFKPLNYESHRRVHEEDMDYLSGIIGKELLKSGKWEIGTVDNTRREEIADVVVDWLYNQLKTKVAELNPEGLIESIYHDLEETIRGLMLAERRYYSDSICYPEKEKIFLKDFNDLNRTSLSLKFLIEFATAELPSGSKRLGSSQYEELLAICSMIIEWAYKRDSFKYNIINSPVEFLKSKRIGMKRDEFEYINHYNESYRDQQLKFNSSSQLRKRYYTESKDFTSDLELAFNYEFGYSYSEFAQVIATMCNIEDGCDVHCINIEDLPSELIALNNSLNEELVMRILPDITYSQRADFLIPPDNFEKTDMYPWRFNRKYCFNRRPVICVGKQLIWGTRQLFHMFEYTTDLIFSGKFKAQSNEMRKLCGKIADSKGYEFNDLIYQMIKDMGIFLVYPNVKKVNGKRIMNDRNDLGDIDLLIIDKEKHKIIVTEVKNFRFSRNPYEIQQEYIKMFVDGKKPCFATKHKKRTQWVIEHMEDLKAQYQLDNKHWKVVSLFIVNQALASSFVYKQDIKSISVSELSIANLRKI